MDCYFKHLFQVSIFLKASLNCQPVRHRLSRTDRNTFSDCNKRISPEIQDQDSTDTMAAGLR